MDYSTECSCGKNKALVQLPQAIEEYQARECDCDFCVSYGLAYISDVKGTLSFSPRQTMHQLNQGSGQATFWQCSNCKDIVAVTHRDNGEERGSVVKTLLSKYTLQSSVKVSPKQLTSEAKPERWAMVWSKVVLE
ncbi:hypothetical protein [Marinomonas mediterranea]|uniref:hypothetical protein n=1 Tax=Marinomonas mediterranea TaxID=119864 RepID=UPI002349BE73|nr:hypothetical protein [Marinomonas mediterranea]WCN08745.1 aldehyde-activating protein [Marinomonas mediterranea]